MPLYFTALRQHRRQAMKNLLIFFTIYAIISILAIRYALFTKNENTDKIMPSMTVWLSNIKYAFAFLLYLVMCIVTCKSIINAPPDYKLFSLYMVIIAGAIGLYSVVLMFMKAMSGVIWCFVSCVFLGLSSMTDLSHMHTDAIVGICAAVLLISQIHYLKWQQIILGGRGFQKSHFMGGASFPDEDFVALNSAWRANSMVFVTFWVPCIAFVLAGIYVLYTGIGGVVGNLLAVVFVLGMSFFALVITKKRKERYLACCSKLNLTDEDIRQALLHKKRGTAADNIKVEIREPDIEQSSNKSYRYCQSCGKQMPTENAWYEPQKAKICVTCYWNDKNRNMIMYFSWRIALPIAILYVQGRF